MLVPLLSIAGVSYLAYDYYSVSKKLDQTASDQSVTDQTHPILLEPNRDSGVQVDETLDTHNPKLVAYKYRKYIMAKQLMQATDPSLKILHSSL